MRLPDTRTAARVAVVGLAALACTASGPSEAELRKQRDDIINSNRLTSNRLTSNRLTSNRLTSNALISNRLTSNRLTSNALISDALTSTALGSDGATEGDAARELLSYVWSCAMPVGVDEELVINGVDYGTLKGALGLAPEWGAPDGHCDVSCQRWVTACLLARTNYYGVPVQISLRGPHPALKATDDEKAEYPLREGGFFGNIFQNGGLEDLYGCAGPASNVPQLTRRFCSGGTGPCLINVRFDCVNPDGRPLPRPTNYAESVDLQRGCQRIDPNDGAVLDCWTGGVSVYGSPTYGTRWPEAITVYLKEPTAICGDGVCTGSETADTCKDCSTGWARGIGGLGGAVMAGATVPPGGGVEVVVMAIETIDLGGGVVKTLPGQISAILARFDPSGRLLFSKVIAYGSVGGFFNLATDTDAQGNIYVVGFLFGQAWFEDLSVTAIAEQKPGGLRDEIPNVYVAKYSPDGQRLWLRQWLGFPLTLKVAADGTAFVTGDGHVPGQPTDLGYANFLVAVSPQGQVLWGKQSQNAPMVNDVSADGDILLSAMDPYSIYELVRWSPDRGETVALPLPVDQTMIDPGLVGPFGAFAADGSVVGVYTTVEGPLLARYSPAGDLLWAEPLAAPLAVASNGRSGPFANAIAIDGKGDIVVAGSFVVPSDFGNEVYTPLGWAPEGSPTADLWMGKYASGGSKRWTKQMGGPGDDLISKGIGMYLRTDPDGVAYLAGEFDLTGVFDGWLLENAYGGIDRPHGFIVAVPDPVAP